MNRSKLEVGEKVEENQVLLKDLLEAARRSEGELDLYVETNRAKVQW